MGGRKETWSWKRGEASPPRIWRGGRGSVEAVEGEVRNMAYLGWPPDLHLHQTGRGGRVLLLTHAGGGAAVRLPRIVPTPPTSHLLRHRSARTGSTPRWASCPAPGTAWQASRLGSTGSYSWGRGRERRRAAALPEEVKQERELGWSNGLGSLLGRGPYTEQRGCGAKTGTSISSTCHVFGTSINFYGPLDTWK
jgi:hypothetical protein